jgi:hypothetical protein
MVGPSIRSLRLSAKVGWQPKRVVNSYIHVLKIQAYLTGGV